MPLEILEVPCSQYTVRSQNDGNSQLAYSYNGDFMYWLNSPKTGILFKFRHRTHTAVANSRNAANTLASKLSRQMFDAATLNLWGTPVESIRHPDRVMDVVWLINNSDVSKAASQKYEFVLDT